MNLEISKIELLIVLEALAWMAKSEDFNPRDRIMAEDLRDRMIMQAQEVKYYKI